MLGFCADFQLHIFLVQQYLKLCQILVYDHQDFGSSQWRKSNDGIQSVSEFGAEGLLDGTSRRATQAPHGIVEAHAALAQILGARIGREDQHHMAEVRLATVIVRERGVVHDL